MLGTFESEDFFALGSRHHQRIDFAAANRVEGILSFLKTLAKLVEFQPNRGFQIWPSSSIFP